jgi:hypothetical protein
MMMALVATALSWASPAAAGRDPGEPVRVVEETVPVPAGMTVEQALASVEDIPRIFDLYEPAIPRLPGVDVVLSKQVISTGSTKGALPAILELPVRGNAVGYKFDERARVTASTTRQACADGAQGRRINLDFHASSYNIERRIDRIEITACPEHDSDGDIVIRAVGRMYAGFKPQDPEKPALSEAIGSRALQSAFIKQVSPILTAVQLHWSML